jgi:hypothetical protein
VLNTDLQNTGTESQKYLLTYLPVYKQWNYTVGAVFKHFGDNLIDNWILSRNMLRNNNFKFSGDQATVTHIIKNFFIPFCRLRDRKKGYAVSLIKSGADIIGRPSGDVRAPLTMPTAAEKEELAAIINANR